MTPASGRTVQYAIPPIDGTSGRTGAPMGGITWHHHVTCTATLQFAATEGTTMTPPRDFAPVGPVGSETEILPSSLQRTRDAIPVSPPGQRVPESTERFRVHRPVPSRADEHEVRAEAARRARRQRRLDRWTEVKLAAAACFALVAGLAVLVVAVLVVGAMLGEWTIPLR